MKDMIPILSWISLRGKCRYCGAPVSSRYTVVESLGGIFAVVWTMIYGIKPMAAVAFIISGIATVAVFLLLDGAYSSKRNDD